MKLTFVADLALGMTAIIAALGAAEVAVRVYATVSRSAAAAEIAQSDPFAVKVRPDGALGYRQTPNTVYRYPNGVVATSNAQGFRGPLVALVKPAGTIRIVLLGGSTTHGWGVPDDSTIDAFMRQELSREYPAFRFEVVNLAFDGYDSFQALERLRVDGLPRDPDVIIVNAGANDVRNARYPELKYGDERSLLWASTMQRLRTEVARGGPTLWTRVKHYSYLLRLPGIVHEHLREREMAGAAPLRPDMAAADYFERNLDQIAELAVGQNACLILSTDPSALRWYRPDTTSNEDYWIGDAAQTQRMRDTLDARTREVVTRWAAAGESVRYVAHDLRRDWFMDDAHLTPAGYRGVAEDFVRAIGALLPPSAGPGHLGTIPACRALPPKIK